jgi:hypothetical protein
MGGGLTGWETVSSTLARMAAGGGDAVVTPVVSVEEEDPMEVQFESQEPVETTALRVCVMERRSLSRL